VKLAGNVVQMQSGATATTATLGALYGASTTGRGQHVDVATFETQNGSADRRRYYLLSYAYSGQPIRRVTAAAAALVAAGGRFEAADGAVITTGRIWPNHLPRMIAVLADDTLSGLFAAKGEAILAEDIETVNTTLAAWAASRPARAAMREAQAAGWPVIVVNDPWTLLRDEHLVARGFWATAPGDGRQLPLCGPPWRIDGGGWHLRRGAPRLGEHTDEVLERVAGYSPETMRALRRKEVVA
jgi:crotonobetainyl-CoA:carnitine CoA-transferase CaiB-like acyl-CoA transferase